MCRYVLVCRLTRNNVVHESTMAYMTGRNPFTCSAKKWGAQRVKKHQYGEFVQIKLYNNTVWPQNNSAENQSIAHCSEMLFVCHMLWSSSKPRKIQILIFKRCSRNFLFSNSHCQHWKDVGMTCRIWGYKNQLFQYSCTSKKFSIDFFQHFGPEKPLTHSTVTYFVQSTDSPRCWLPTNQSHSVICTICESTWRFAVDM